MRIIWQPFCIGLILALLFSPLLDFVPLQRSPIVSTAFAASHRQQTPNTVQTPDLFLKELQTIYLSNLERRKHGLAPLRWNRQLHLAARWFSADATEGRAEAYCGHVDSQERTPGERFLAFGYRNSHAWGENVICGLTEPEYAVAGWMNSEGHRANLLHPEYREIGVGYFQQGTSGRGYITQDLSADPKYAPVVIENEAPATSSASVNLYIYDPAVGEGLRGMGTAVEMMIANEPDFIDSAWEPFVHEKSWQLLEGEGWRSVYVKTRDAQGRTSTVFDTIYLGSSLPTEELDLQQACGFRPRIAIDSLDETGWPQVQLSLNWLGDNDDSTFQDSNQIGQRISDADAVGESAYFMAAGNNSGRVRYWTTSFYKDVPLIAYFRVKATNIATANKVLEITISGGGTTYGPVVIKGTDFTEANSYREFALPFQFNSNADDPYLTFNFEHTGESDIYLDTISIFTESMSIHDEVEWQVLGGYHRSRGIWARFIQPDGTFTAPTDLQVFGANTQITVPPIVPSPTLLPPADQPPTDQPPIDTSQLNHHLYIPITMR